MQKIYGAFLVAALHLSGFAVTPSYFIENKGQLRNQDNLPNTAVKYIYNAPGLNLQLKANSFSYDTYSILCRPNPGQTNLPKSLSGTETSYSFHRIDVEFLGANPAPEILEQQQAPGLIHHNLIHSIRSFQKIVYRNLYPNTDLEFITVNGTVKYNFILYPGADLSLIKWQYKGASATSLKNKNIVLRHANGSISETIPESFLLTSSSKINVSVHFSEADGVYGFQSRAKITAGKTLVIDPSPILDWATYYGSSGNEGGYGSAVDPSGNVILVGETSSAANIATTGIYQTTFGGTSDAFIAKFDNSGTRLWCTYFGGTGSDVALSVVTNSAGVIYVAGQTNSAASISFGTVHQTSFGGLYDAFLAKLDRFGLMIWSTYYGGTGYEDGNAVALDANDNAYLTGYTDSPSGIVSGGAHQTAFGGIYDAFLAKFDPSGTRLWGTYYGGAGDDYGLAATIDNSGNIFIAGQTASSGAISSTGAHQTVWGGTDDAFVVQFNTNGVRQWATYYGDADNETAFAACTDAVGNVYICGQTSSSLAISTTGAQQTTISTGPDAFAAKFTNAGTRLWGTYYGDAGYDAANAMVADASGIVIAGKTGSGTGFSTTNSQQGTFGGFNDAFLVRLSAGSGVRTWGTYYGGNGDDTGNGLSRDASGKFFMAGTTASSLAISTPGSFQPVKDASYDAFLARFGDGCFNPPSPGNSTPATNLTICSGNSAVLTAAASGTLTWYTAASGGPYAGSGTPFTTPTLSTTTTFYAQDSTACGPSLVRTSITVSVNPTPTVSFGLPINDTLVCLTHSPFTMNTGTPAGGVYSGTGVSGAVFTPSVAGVGTFSITYLVTAGSCTNAAQSVVRVKSCAGIEEYEAMNELVSVYPNPNNGSFYIRLPKAGSLELVNALGETIKQFELNASTDFSGNIGGLAAGTYFILGKNDLAFVKKKIVVIE
ncbi:MAG: DUF7948 domain-containing protein [Bacteroidia bacterium]